MLEELVCHHTGKNKKRYVFLNRPSYKVGKALDNDIVLLEADVPPYMAVLERINGQYVWKENSDSRILNPAGYESSGFHFRIRKYRKPALILASAYMVLAVFLTTRHFLGHPQSLDTEKPISETSEIDASVQPYELFLSARKFFQERAIQPGNIARSAQMLDQAKKVYEKSGMDLPGDFETFQQEVLEAKNKLIRDHKLAAQKFSRQGYTQKARQIYQKLLGELIDPNDPDRLAILREIRTD